MRRLLDDKFGGASIAMVGWSRHPLNADFAVGNFRRPAAMSFAAVGNLTSIKLVPGAAWSAAAGFRPVAACAAGTLGTKRD